MKLNIGLDRAGLATVFRTTAALLIGNSIVIPVLTDGKAQLWWILLAAGVALMIGAVNGCRETLFSGCEDAVSSVGGVWIVIPCVPMPGRPEGGQALARGLAGGLASRSVEVMALRSRRLHGRFSRARVACSA